MLPVWKRLVTIPKTGAEYLFKCLVEDLSCLQEMDSNAGQKELSAESFISLNKDFATTTEILINTKILADILNLYIDENKNDEVICISNNFHVESSTRSLNV